MAVAEVDLEMDDLFGDGQDVDELMDQPTQEHNLDDEAVEAPEHGEGQTQEGEGDMEVLNRLRDLSKGAAKKRVMKPQPKLDPTRLQGERGLPALKKTFEDVKFKGKGYEKDDLLKMMSTLEHWAHRLFPKTSFDDFIERLEKLGAKKAVQTTVKRIRMDMPILNEDFVGNEPEDATALVDENNAEDDNNEPNNPEMDAEEAYEEMIRQEREEQEQQKATQQQNGEDDPFKSPRGSPERDESIRETPKTPAGSSTPSTVGSKSLTAEQQERMERNKRLAMERRMKKMGITPGKSPVAQAGSTSSSPSKPSNSVQSTPSLGSQRPADAELANELLRDLNETPNKTNGTDSGATQLDLHLTESEPSGEKSKGSQSTEPVSACDGKDGAGKETISNENGASQNTKDLNLQLSESENIVQSEDNTEKLDLRITQSEKDGMNSSNTNQNADSSENVSAKEQLMNGHNSTEDDSILSEKSDKGTELKLKLSVSDSDNMEVDE